MKNVFLPEWQAGDELKASDLNAVVAAVSMLEQMTAGTNAVPAMNCVRKEPSQQFDIPFRVRLVARDGGMVVEVAPGVVITGCHAAEYDDAGEEIRPGGYLYEEFSGGQVEDFNMAASAGEAGQHCVYLQMDGSVELRRLTQDDVTEEGYLVVDQAIEHVELRDVKLSVTCEPSEDALRVWPLAIVNMQDRQPVTQLLWGTLSALECTAVCTAEGEVIKPAALPESRAEWGAIGHTQGMVDVAELNFSTQAENINGTLRAALDEDGALEFYIGPLKDGTVAEQPADDWGDSEDPADPEIPDGAPEWRPPAIGGGSGGGDDDESGGVEYVRYGYAAGEGFSWCYLTSINGEPYWYLELDGNYLWELCADLKAPAQVTVAASGAQQGTYAAVSLGVGTVGAQSSSLHLAAEVSFVFSGTDGDVIVSETSFETYYTARPEWIQQQIWYLSPRALHRAGRYVKLSRMARPSSGSVKAWQWWQVSVNKKAFRKAAEQYFRQQIAKITVSGNSSAEAEDSLIVGMISGTATAPKVTFILGDK